MAQKEEILNYFRILKNRDILGASYLFIGQDYSLVRDIIKLISCSQASCGSCWDCRQIQNLTHPDLLAIEPQGLSIKIESIREAIKFLSLKSFALGRKVILIQEGQFLTPAAANAFLKTLEEPPRNSLIMICVSKLEGLLPTIISRCRKIYLPALSNELWQVRLSQISDFFAGENLKFVDRKKFAAFLWDLIVFLRNSLLYRRDTGNNRLPADKDYEIILGSKGFLQIEGILDKALKVYGAYNTVNMNLALNLIRMSL